MFIRKAEIEDLDQIVEIDRSAFETDAYGIFVVRQLFDLFPHLVFISELPLTNEIIGYIIGGISESGTEGWILALGISEQYRRGGIGEALSNQLISEMRQLKLQKIRLTVKPSNAAAKSLYKKLGFQKLGYAVNYFGEGQDREVLFLGL